MVLETPDGVQLLFSSRDEGGRSHVLATELTITDSMVEAEPRDLTVVLAPGGLGGFDEDGVMACSVIAVGDTWYLYYVGWNRGVTVPFRNALGLAVSDDGGVTWRRQGDGPIDGPILDRSIHDPAFVASGCAFASSDGYRMLYTSGVAWEPDEDQMKPHYNLKMAQSPDARAWLPTGQTAIDFASTAEHAITCPTVLDLEDRLVAWFCARGEHYSIYVAESTDGIEWRRHADPVLDVGTASWEDQMVCYPRVLRRGKQLIMVYNGNGYGRTGIGYATAELE